MDWQAKKRMEYEQSLLAKEQAKQQEAARMRLQLKQQFAESQQRKQEQQHLSAQQSAETELLKQQEQQAIHLRIASDLKHSNEEKYKRYQEALQRIQQGQAQQSQIWTSKDGKEFRSPLERDFWDAWIADASGIPLIPQHPIDRYRVDFAHIESKTIIELDGHMHHTSKHAFTHDHVRQRYLEKQGWRVIRFSGQEICFQLDNCIAEAFNFIKFK